MTRQVVVVGAGEHGRVVSEAASSAGWQVIGYTDAADVAGLATLPCLGTDARFAADLASREPDARPSLILGVGGPVSARRRAVAAFGPEAVWAVVVHPAAWVAPSAAVAPGAVVLAGAVVNTGATIGAHAIVNSGAVVEHDVRIGTHVHVAPGALVGGGAQIGDEAFLGLGSGIRDHVTVGARAIIGMGAVVVGDVADDAVMTGIPARAREADRGEA